MLDNPRIAIVGLSLVLKFGLDSVYSFRDIVIFTFCPFWLETACLRPFLWGRDLGYTSPKYGHPSF